MLKLYENILHPISFVAAKQIEIIPHIIIALNICALFVSHARQVAKPCRTASRIERAASTLMHISRTSRAFVPP